MLTKLGLSLFELIAKQPKRSVIYAVVSQLCIIAWLDLTTPNASLLQGNSEKGDLQKYLDESALAQSLDLLTFSIYEDGEKQIYATSKARPHGLLPWPDGVLNVANTVPIFADWYQAHLSGNCWSYVADKPSLLASAMEQMGAKAIYACPVYSYGTPEGKQLIGTISITEQQVSTQAEAKYLALRGIAKSLGKYTLRYK